VALIIVSGCVCNNVLDRRIDAKMKRTRIRALVTGRISIGGAMTYAVVTGLVGLALLCVFVNTLTALLGFVGFVSYVVLYGAAKRAGTWGTLVGSISGAMPLVAGYTGASNTWDSTASLLFVMMALWQVPHFYAIAMYRRAEYAATGLPIFSVVHEHATTRRHIIGYSFGFLLAAVLLAAVAPVGYGYLVGIIAVTSWWLVTQLRSPANSYDKWARKVFGGSLVTLLAMNTLLALRVVLP
jgi:protoheme IX farnesyltransferase